MAVAMASILGSRFCAFGLRRTMARRLSVGSGMRWMRPSRSIRRSVRAIVDCSTAPSSASSACVLSPIADSVSSTGSCPGATPSGLRASVAPVHQVRPPHLPLPRRRMPLWCPRIARRRPKGYVNQVTVEVHRHRRGGMSERPLNDLGVGAAPSHVDAAVCRRSCTRSSGRRRAALRKAAPTYLAAVHREFADHLTVREAEVLAGALRKVLAAGAAGDDRNPLVGLRDRRVRSAGDSHRADDAKSVALETAASSAQSTVEICPRASACVEP